MLPHRTLAVPRQPRERRRNGAVRDKSAKHPRRLHAAAAQAGARSRTQPCARAGTLGFRDSRSAHPGHAGGRTGASDTPAGGPVGPGLRFVGCLRSGVSEPAALHAVRLRKSRRVGARETGVHPPRRVRAHGGACRQGEDSFRSAVRGLPSSNRRGRAGRTQFREESGQLGLAADRKTQ